MRFAKAGRRYADELRLRAKRLDRRASNVAHAASQAADHLKEHVANRSLVRHAPLNALGHQLPRRQFTLLEIPVRAAVLHCRKASHSANHLEATTLEQERL